MTTRFLRPTGPLGDDGWHDTYDIYDDGEFAGSLVRSTGISGGFLYTAKNGDTHIFGIKDPREAAKQMLEVQAAGGAAAVTYAYERANGWSTD